MSASNTVILVCEWLIMWTLLASSYTSTQPYIYFISARNYAHLDTWPQRQHCVHSCSGYGSCSPGGRTHYHYSEHCPTKWDQFLDQSVQSRMQVLLKLNIKYNNHTIIFSCSIYHQHHLLDILVVYRPLEHPRIPRSHHTLYSTTLLCILQLSLQKCLRHQQAGYSLELDTALK